MTAHAEDRAEMRRLLDDARSDVTEHPTDALKPCPFCGALLALNKWDEWYHEITDCPLSDRIFDSAEAAAWNTRTPSTPAIDDEGLVEKVAFALAVQRHGQRYAEYVRSKPHPGWERIFKAEARAAIEAGAQNPDNLTEMLLCGAVSLAPDDDGHVVRVDFSERADAERFFDYLTGKAIQG